MLSSLAILFIAPLFSDALYIEQHSTDTATLHSIPESTTLPRRAPTDSASITWSACPDPEIPPELECGTLLVPLDHAHPPSVAEYNANNTVELFMSRLKATGIPPDQIEGRASLIINPGGPGGTAWVMAVYQLQAEMAGHPDAVVSAAVRGKYDLIGVDPRGAGLSQGLKCDESLLKTKPSIRIQDEQEFEAMAEWNKQYAESCERLSGDLVRYMGTVSVAKDFELVRQALGEEKLNLFAMSYGSRIGAEYINLYPEHIGRFVLDGILDNTQDARGLMTSDAKAFEDALTFYFGWCNNSPECTAVLDTASPAVSCASKLFDRIMLKLQSDRLPAGGCDNPEAPCASSIGLEDFIKGVQEGLGNQDETDIRPNGWLTLTKCMVEVDGGDGTAFSPALAPSDGAVDIYAPSDPHAGTAVSCLESPRIGSFAEYADINATLFTDYPHTKGNSWASSMVVGCIGWPVPVVDPPRPLNTEAVAKSAKVLLLQSTVDPSTNMDWAESLHRQLPNSRLVVRKGAGHTSMVLFGESSRTAETYLLEGALPDEDVQVDT